MSKPSGPAIKGLSRRRLFRWSTSLAASLGALQLFSSARSLASPEKEVEGEDYYDKLGVPKILNAAGTYTTLTASCMPPVVLAAVQKAALHPVRLADLQTNSGEYIAKRLQCEGAVVTSGASGAITLATAACLQYANNISPLAMPQAIDGLKNQVIVQQAHRYGYDHAMFLCGARVREVVTLDDYKRACAAGNAIMTNFFNAAGRSGFALPTSAISPATSTQRRICPLFRTYGNIRGWALTWFRSPEARACAGRRTQACCWAGSISPISPSRTTTLKTA
jgi:L-seryl-tRNA(Ser) seleniumtransferase